MCGVGWGGGHALCCGLIKYFFIQKERKKIYMYERFTVEKGTECMCVCGGGGRGAGGMSLILRRVIIFNAATLIQQCRI